MRVGVAVVAARDGVAVLDERAGVELRVGLAALALVLNGLLVLLLVAIANPALLRRFA